MKFIYSIILILALASCSSEKQNDADENGKLNVVTTTGIIGSVVESLGGEMVEVTSLMGPGVDPHLYKASQGDIRKLINADIIFYNGLHLEGKMVDVLEKLGRNKSVIAVSVDIPEDMLRQPLEFKGAFDPHIWFDVSLWRQTIPVIERDLIAALPEEKAAIAGNAAAYSANLDSLHQWIKSQIQLIPNEQRVLVTAHDAFGYFGKAYKIDVLGLQGISTVSEFGVKDITLMVDFITDKRVKAIFVESSVSRRSIEAVQLGCVEKGWQVIIGGTLYSDALGGPGSGAENYPQMVRANVNTIVGSLR